MAHKTAEFELLVQELLEEWHVPGLSIAVIEDKEIYAKGFGYANLENTKCTEDTIFNLASTSKTTTAAAVARLVQDEKYPNVQWTSPVSQLLPDDFVLSDPEYTKAITIEDILSHRTGMPGHDDSYLSIYSKDPDNAQSITRNLRNLPVNAPLRTKYQYSNIMFTIATHLVSTISETEYPSFLQKHLWDPLHMTSTYHDLPGLSLTHPGHALLATAYHWDTRTSTYKPCPSFPQPEGQGAGCIYSTAKSYARWVRALMHPSDPSNPLTEESIIELTTPRTVIPSSPAYTLPFHATSLCALGLEKDSYRGHDIVGHDGSEYGFMAKIAYLPGSGYGIVMLGNGDRACEVMGILWMWLVDRVIGVREEERIDWRAFWRERWDREEGEEKSERMEREKDKQGAKKDTEDGGGDTEVNVNLEDMVGRYEHRGYHELVLEIKDGRLMADCTDRCFGFWLLFRHIKGDEFAVEWKYQWAAEAGERKAGTRLSENGRVEAVGVECERAMEGYLMWFERTE